MRILLATSILLLVLTSSVHASEEPIRSETDELFEKKIRPLLVAECFQCHGGGRKLKGGLRMATRELLIQGGHTGPAIDLTNPQASLLVRAIRYEDPELEMPPWGPLEEEQVNDLISWVEKGAPWSGGPLAIKNPEKPKAPAPGPGDGPGGVKPKPGGKEKPPTPEEVAFFEKRIYPVLEKNCFECHGGKDFIEADLHLTSREGMLHGGYSGRAVHPGRPEDSLLIEAIRYTDFNLMMPPKGKLDALAIADLYTWIKAGAVWPPDEPENDPEER